MSTYQNVPSEPGRPTDFITSEDSAPSAPNPDLRCLDRLLGTWSLGGDTSGTVSFEWMAGEHFMLQHFDLTLHGHRVIGLEVIGHLRPYGEEPGADIASRAYDNSENTLDYVYQVNDSTLTIWAGYKGSPAFFRGEFSADGRTTTGDWEYEGGGYHSTMTRVD